MSGTLHEGSGRLTVPVQRGLALVRSGRLRPPQMPPRVVVRHRLDQLLNRASQRRLALVSAEPGSGKTSAVAGWAARMMPPGTVAWLTVDESDNDQATFWGHLLAALRISGCLTRPTGLADLSPASTFNRTDIERVAAGLGALPHPLLLVLDDLHEITDIDVLAGIDLLIERAPPNVRLMLLSRADPGLTLHRLRLSGELAEIRGADLAFDPSEADQMLEADGLALDPAHRDMLMARTEGWAAGLRLAAISLAGQDIDRAIKAFSGQQEPVAEYLVGEVFQQQSRDVREVLLTTSITERICGPLADHLTNASHGQLILERLCQANALVISLDADNTWFRCHPLLRQMLLHRLRLEQPSMIQDLHRKASDWFAAQGLWVEAIRHASEAAAWPDVRRILAEAALPGLLSSERGALAASLRPAAAQARTSPDCDTLIAAGACHFFDSSYAAMAEDATGALRRLPDLPPGEQPAALAVIRLYQMAATRVAGGVAETAELALDVFRVLDGTSAGRLPAARSYRVLASGHLAGAQMWAGRFVEARHRFEAVAAEGAELGLESPRMNALAHLAAMSALRGGLRAARSGAADVLSIADRRGWAAEPQIVAAYLAMGVVELGRDSLDAARIHLQRGLAVPVQTDGALAVAMRIALAHLAVATRDVAAALLACAELRRDTEAGTLAGWLDDWLRQAEIASLLLMDQADVAVQRLRERSVLDPDEQLLLIKAEFAAGRPHLADDLCRQLLERPTDNLATHVGAWLATALAADLRHDDAHAMQALQHAISLAAPEDLRRPFRSWGPRMNLLIERHRDAVDAWGVSGTDWLTTARPQPPREGAEWPLEGLTERERAVLQYLPTLLTNEEISHALVISVNTVKAHLKSLYRKLRVGGRRDAVRRARELDLL